jgi:hypothetical protein
MGAALEHVERDPKTGRLTYRRVYPLALRPFIPSPNVQLKRSLAAKVLDAPGAVERYRDAAAQYAATVALARKVAAKAYDHLDPALIAHLANSYVARELAADDKMAWGEAAERGYARRLDLEDDYRECREMLREKDRQGLIVFWTEWAPSYATSLGFMIDPASPQFGNFAIAMGEAACNTWLTIDARRDDTQRLDGKSIETPLPPLAPQIASTAGNTPNEAGESFDAIANAILANPREAISPSTRQGAQTALRFLMEALGPVAPAAITRRAVTDWLDLMAQRPARLPRAQRAATLRELATLYADRPEVPRLSPVTLDHHVCQIAPKGDPCFALNNDPLQVLDCCVSDVSAR